MRHTIYEDPITHKFAWLRLPNTFVDGDKLPMCTTDRWFQTREEAVAALSELFDVELDGESVPHDRPQSGRAINVRDRRLE